MENLAILVVDDHQAIRQIIADVLRRAGFKNLRFAENGKIALKKLEEQPVDLIILDWDMPVMTGVEVLGWMQGKEAYEGVRRLMLTAHAEREDVIEAVSLGVNDYIVKPFAPGTLLEKLKSMFGKLPSQQ